MERILTLGSFFDGIGGALLAARHTGIKPLWASEIESFPRSITEKRFPEGTHLGDITKINPDELSPVDVICAGSPCQDLSIAGKREGLKGERSGLFKTAINLFHQLRERTGRPRFFVWENVPGAFSSNKGADFRAVLEEIGQTEIPTPPNGKWANAGMVECDSCQIAWRVLDAQYWGVPQRRRRIFLVADFTADGRCAGEILFEPEGMSRDTTESTGARKRTARGVEDCTRTPGRPHTYAYPFDSVASNSMKSSNPHSGCCRVELAKTLDTTNPAPSKNQGGIAILTRAAGFIGKATPSAGNIGYAEELAPTLLAGKEQHVAIYDITHADEVIRPVKDGIVPTLNARMGTGGNQVPVVHAYCIAGNTIDRKIENGGNGKGVLTETAYTLNTIDRHAVAEIYGAKSYSEYEPGKVATLRASVGAYGGGSENLTLSYSIVRLLTPTECERLQGLPDGYTEGGSDTARYKALGNGMAQPCIDYVIQRIAECVS